MQQQNQFISGRMQESITRIKSILSASSTNKPSKTKAQSTLIVPPIQTIDIRSTCPQPNLKQQPQRQQSGQQLRITDHHSVITSANNKTQTIAPIKNTKSLGSKNQHLHQSNKETENLPEEGNLQQKLFEHSKTKKNGVSQRFKKQLLARDQYQHPLKYKIVAQQLGYNPEKIFKLNNADLTLIQQHYQRRKGLQYLKQSRATHSSKSNKFTIKLKTQPSVPQKLNPSRSRQYIHKIFGPLPKQKKSHSQSDKNLRRKSLLQNLQEKQDILGKVVYNRVKKHLKQQRVSNDFYKRVHSQQAIDQALIQFLKLKIARAQTSLKHV